MSLWRDVASITADVMQFFVKLEAKNLLAKSVELQLKRVCFWGGLLVACLLVLLAGIGLIIAGAWILLTPVTGTGVAAVIVGVVVALAATALAFAIKSCMK